MATKAAPKTPTAKAGPRQPGQPSSKAGTTPNYSDQERKQIIWLDHRINEELKTSRKQVGKNKIDIDKLWADADRAYEPHRLGVDSQKTRTLVQDDETTGLRGASTFVKLGSDDDWRSDRSQPNIYTKIQTGLSVLVDSNPEGVFIPEDDKYEESTIIHKDLHRTSWEKAFSKEQLKQFVLNLAKLGFAVARTYPLNLRRIVRDLDQYDPKDRSKTKYKYREQIDFDGVFRENLDPRFCWFDPLAKPNNPLSGSDWYYEMNYTADRFQAEFGDYDYAKHILPTSIKPDGTQEEEQNVEGGNLYRMGFYENRDRDWYAVKANGVWICVNDPLPAEHKQLSCWYTHWSLRDETTIYGIGLFEILRYDQELKDQIRNMTIDQLVLSIYKFWLYSGTNQPDGAGVIKVTPGVGKQIADTKNIQFVDIPGPGAESAAFMDRLDADMEEASAITKPLQGEAIGKTAYESQSARQESLKRLRLPLENIAFALAIDAYLTVSLNEQILSVPEVIALEDEDVIKQYLQEISNDPDLYESYTDEEAGRVVFNALVPKKIQLGLETDAKGQLVKSENQRFFRVRPSKLPWNGTIRIRPQSIITPSVELDKQMDLELFNLVLPIFTASLMPSPDGSVSVNQQYVAVTIKPVKQIMKRYEKDPADWMPDAWLNPPAPQAPALPPGPAGAAPGQDQPLIVPQNGGDQPLIVPQQNNFQPQPLQESPTISGGSVAQATKRSIVGRINAATNPVG